MKRFPFLDWMRGLAVVVMIQCHTFNSLARLDVREGGPYVLSQFIGGMAAPLFLFMAGMTLAFQMESLYRREPDPRRRWVAALRRAGYILFLAFAFRAGNFVASLPHPDASDLLKVDILNCMAVALGALSVAAVFDAKGRARFAAAAGLAIAAASPVMANLPWDGAPQLLHDYVVPAAKRGTFAFFPCAAYAAFGIAAGTLVKRTTEDRMDRLMQWAVLLGFPLIFTAQYFADIPFSIYPRSNFWSDSPALIFMRTGIMLLMTASAYLWTAYIAGAGWSWMQALGKNSLMVYWVHVMLVYGDIVKPLKRTLSVPQTVAAVAVVMLLMIGLSAAWLKWKARARPAARVAPVSPAGVPQGRAPLT